jgi:small subunit ribosomal protein S3
MIAEQIERRLPFRRIMKSTLEKIMGDKEVKGAKLEFSGRLGGAEIARREWLSRGQLPLTSLRARIDYAQEEALCTYGKIGIKVWIYKGEKTEEAAK